MHRFESSVNSYGGKTYAFEESMNVLFERSVISYDGKTIVWLSYMEKSNWRKND